MSQDKMYLYLDNNATTRLDEEVLQTMTPFFTEYYANPSALYGAATKPKQALEIARNQTAILINAHPDELIFTGCGTEADNTAIFSGVKCRPTKKHVIISAIEHPAVTKAAESLVSRGYIITKLLPTKDGVITAKSVATALRPDTALVSVMWANNETGVINPIEEIGKLVKANGSMYHVDATQAVGKIPVDFRKSLADYLVFSAHKIHGPKGVGILVVRQGACYFPLLLGGSQEHECRAGTENVAGIVGTGMASLLARQNLPIMQTEVSLMRDWLERQIVNIFGSEIIVLGNKAIRTPNTLMLAIHKANGRELQSYLSNSDIAVGIGSACACLKTPKPSETVKSMRVPLDYQLGTLRISLSKYNSASYGGSFKDFDQLLAALANWKIKRGVVGVAPPKLNKNN